MADLLDADDLAFMRETQTATRPTPAVLLRRYQGTTPSGGRGNTYGPEEPVDIRLDGKEKRIPPQVVGVVGSGKAVKIVMDLVEVRSGDLVKVSETEQYEVVTDGLPDQWATAQIVYARRMTYTPRTMPPPGP